MVPVISIRVHRILDFIISLLLIGFGWTNNFSTEDPVVPGTLLVAGILLLTYGLFTRYQKNGKGSISIRSHIVLDCLLGITLAASPWLFGFSHLVKLPHVVGGLLLIVTAFFSRGDYKKPGHHRSSREHRPA
jgi:hypothetical protein